MKKSLRGPVVRTRGVGIFIPVGLLSRKKTVRVVLDIKAELHKKKAVIRVGRFRPGTEEFEEGVVIGKDIDADGLVDEIILSGVSAGDPLESVANKKTLSRLQKKLLGVD